MEPSSFFVPGLAAGRSLVLALLLLIAIGVTVRGLLLKADREGWRRRGRLLEQSVLALILAAMIGLSIFQIVLRNVFDAGYIWIDPLLRALVLWVAFLGALAATARGRHIAIDVVSRMLPPRGRSILVRIVSLLAGAICVALANGSYEYLGLEREFTSEAFLGIPSWVVQSVLLLGFALLAFRFLADAVLGPDPAAGPESMEPSA